MREAREAGGATARGTEKDRGTGKGRKGMNVALCTFFVHNATFIRTRCVGRGACVGYVS